MEKKECLLISFIDPRNGLYKIWSTYRKGLRIALLKLCCFKVLHNKLWVITQWHYKQQTNILSRRWVWVVMMHDTKNTVISRNINSGKTSKYIEPFIPLFFWFKKDCKFSARFIIKIDLSRISIQWSHWKIQIVFCPVE